MRFKSLFKSAEQNYKEGYHYAEKLAKEEGQAGLWLLDDMTYNLFAGQFEAGIKDYLHSVNFYAPDIKP